MTSKHHHAALAKARQRLIRDMALFAIIPVIACWGLWFVLGKGFVWPLIPTVFAAAWMGAVWGRWRETFVNIPPKPMQNDMRHDVKEIPRIRFDDDGNPTESFIQELHQRDKKS